MGAQEVGHSASGREVSVVNSKSGRIIAASCVLLGLAGCVAYVLVPGGVGGGGGGAGAQAISDAGKFKVGSALGQERAGFSGRAMVQIFTWADDPNWPAISACLRSPEVEAEMASFTGIIVDAQAEPEVESIGKRQDGVRVIVRRLNGELLRGLPAGFSCADLVHLLNYIRQSRSLDMERSPIYASLMESPEAVVDDLKGKGEAVQAARFVELLKEFEGAQSPAVLAAETQLNR